MNNLYDISFIVPVYNIENYLDDCIKSILMQSHIHYEIILVNDGSTDNSLNICLDYQKQYTFIKVIDKSNEGVAIARNEGLKIATGEYICFIDSDDFYLNDFAYDFLQKCHDNKLDIIRGLYNIYDDEDKRIIENLQNINYFNIPLSGREFLVNSIQNNTNEVVPWLGFFKRSFINDNAILFPNRIAYEEDQLFFLQALLSNECRIMQADNYFYAYRKRNGSCTAHPKIKNIEDACFIVNEELNLINKLKLDNKTKEAAYIYASWSFFQVTTLFGRLSKEEQEKAYKLMPKNVIVHAIKHPTSKKNKYKVMLLKYFPQVYSIVFSFIKSIQIGGEL
jgi:glycosyltransferase involved in cell wall biosynthesis